MLHAYLFDGPFIIYKHLFWIKVSKDKFNKIPKKEALVQLSTLKAKGEALKIRQAYEVARVKSKFDIPASAHLDLKPHIKAQEEGEQDVQAEEASNSDTSSASGDAAFDEPIKVRRKT